MISDIQQTTQSLIATDTGSSAALDEFTRFLEEFFELKFQIETIDPAQADQTELLTVGDDGECRLCIPVPHGCLQVREPETLKIAVACTRSADPALLEKMARACLRQMQLNSQVDDLMLENEVFVRQVTENLEELAFFHDIAGGLEINDQSTLSTSISSELLESLRFSLKAETVVFLPHDNTYCEPVDRRARNVSMREPLELETFVKPIGVGKEVVDHDTLRKLVSEYPPVSTCQPRLMNHFQLISSSHVDYALVRSFVVAPLSRSSQDFGWLLAINRLDCNSTDHGDIHWSNINRDFGSGEAMLLMSAASMFAAHLNNVRLFHSNKQLVTGVVKSLVSAIEAKDNYTCGHSERVALYGHRLALEAGYDEKSLQRIYLSGLLHDVGKIAIPDATLNNPGALSEEEMEQIRSHPDEGWAILQDLNDLLPILPGVLFHHERYDGKGYPDGLAGKDIPDDGRVLAIADAFDAMTSDRPYRRGMPVEKATSILQEGAGTQWDPNLVSMFLRIIDNIREIKKSYKPFSRPERKHRPPEIISGQPS